jgi:hypothetical protein
MGSPITVYRPNSNVIRLGGGSRTSVAGSPGGGGSGGVGDIFNFFKGLAQDRDNKLILENHGMDREAVDLLSAEDRSALVTSVSANDVKRLEQEETGGNVQSGVDIFAKLSEANKKLDQDRNIPLELQFGRGINSKDPTSNETGGEQIPNKSPEEFTTNDDGSVNLNELNVNASRDIPDSRSTVEVGREGEAFPPKSGTELLTDLFRSKDSASPEQIDRREQAGAPFMKPSQIVEAEKGNLLARLTGQAGGTTARDISIKGQNYKVTRDNVTGVDSIESDTITPESLAGLTTDDLTNPATKKPGVAIINKVDQSVIFLKDKDGNWLSPAPSQQRFKIDFAEKSREKAIEEARSRVDLSSESTLTFGNIKSRYKPAYVTNLGRLGYSVAGLIDNFKKLDPKTSAGSFLAKAGAFYQDVQAAFLEYRHRLTGAAGSDVEMGEIRKSFLNPEQDGGTLFESNLDRLLSIADEHHKIELQSVQLLEQGKSLTYVAIKKRDMIRAMLEAKGVTLGKVTKSATYNGDPTDFGAAKKHFLKGIE